jgi:hypothetical protein
MAIQSMAILCDVGVAPDVLLRHILLLERELNASAYK